MNRAIKAGDVDDAAEIYVEKLAGEELSEKTLSLLQEALDHLMCRSQDWLYSGFSQEDLATLDRLQKKMLRNLSALIQQDNKEVTQT